MTKIPVQCGAHPDYDGSEHPDNACFSCHDLYHWIQQGGFTMYGIHELMPTKDFEAKIKTDKLFKNYVRDCGKGL